LDREHVGVTVRGVLDTHGDDGAKVCNQVRVGLVCKPVLERRCGVGIFISGKPGLNVRRVLAVELELFKIAVTCKLLSLGELLLQLVLRLPIF
jgi:hypothetical protein